MEGNNTHGGHRCECEGDTGHPYMYRIFFTFTPVASMWVVALHNLFLHSDSPLPCHPPSYWLRLFSSRTFSGSVPHHSLPILHTYPPMKMEQSVCSQMLAYKIQNPGNYPDESIQQHKKCQQHEMLLPCLCNCSIQLTVPVTAMFVQLQHPVDSACYCHVCAAAASS